MTERKIGVFKSATAAPAQPQETGASVKRTVSASGEVFGFVCFRPALCAALHWCSSFQALTCMERLKTTLCFCCRMEHDT